MIALISCWESGCYISLILAVHAISDIGHVLQSSVKIWRKPVLLFINFSDFVIKKQIKVSYSCAAKHAWVP